MANTEEKAQTKELPIFPHMYYFKFCIYAQAPLFNSISEILLLVPLETW
jgi:hypothetical protein